jgi:lysophospholipase L1-like esterase
MKPLNRLLVLLTLLCSQVLTIGAAGIPLAGITVDNPYEYLIGEHSSVSLKDPKSVDWLKRVRSYEDFARERGLDPNTAGELRARDGLPNFFAKLEKGGPVRIAYLGGSITAANGWRPKSLAAFKSQYPGIEMIEINAAISGTGSDFGACRMAADVLSRDPDLVFMEHRVNGGGGFEAKSVEGIVRQIWRKNPRTDICLIYTLSEGMLKTLQDGKQTSFGRIMETIANAYGIPSIDLGVEIAKREKAGELVFKSNTAVEGKLVFSKDGVHPGNEGHDVYRDVIARSMLAMKSAAKPLTHRLPEPLEARCWESASLVPIAHAAMSSGWKIVDINTDAIYREDFGRTDAMLRGAMKCDKAGETITVQWNGTTLGFSDIPQGNGMEVELTIDNAQTPIVIKRPQTESIRRYARFFYLPEQSPGGHTAVLKVKQLPEGQSFYAGQLLVVSGRASSPGD